ncbi:MAG: Tol biopolymer transport system component, partial [Myxococcota bacterium]
MNLGLCLSLVLTLTAPANAAEISVAERGHASNPTWSAGGDWLAFEVNDYNGSVSLYVIKVSGGNPVGTPSKASIPGQSSSLASGGSMAANTVWHPEGMAIFEGSSAGGSSRLYFLSPGGSAPSQLLTSGQIGGDLTWPDISGDGMKVAFVSDSTGDGDIYIWDRNSNAVTAAIQSPYSEMAPTFSSNGTLAYSRKNQGGQDIFLWTDG